MERHEAWWGPTVFVLSVWVGSLVATLIWVWVWGSPFPRGDDWEMVPALTGDQLLTVSWLWSQHGWHLGDQEQDLNEHRLPVSRLVLWAVLKVSRGDFRSGLVTSVLALGGMALGLIWSVRTLRGRTAYSDAFFPLVLLSWGHWASLLWSWQLVMVLPAFLACLLGILVVRRRAPYAPGFVCLYGALVVLLAWSETAGLAFVPALALGLVYSAVLHWRSSASASRKTVVVHMIVALTLLLLVPLYLYHLKEVNEDYSLGFWLTLKTSAWVLTQGLGVPFRAALWPYSGLAVSGLFLISVLALLRLAWMEPRERFRALQLCCFLGGGACLFLAIGKARAAELQSGLTELTHLTCLTLPVLCGIYLTWVLWGGQGGELVQTSLFTLACFLVWPNVQEGLAQSQYRSMSEELRRDIRAGMPLSILAERQLSNGGAFSDPGFGKEYLEAHFRMLYRARIGPVAEVDDPPVNEVPVIPKPTSLSEMTWKAGTGYGTGIAPTAIFVLPKPTFVYAIRLNYTYPEAASDALLVFYSKKGKGGRMEALAPSSLVLERQRPASAVFWVNEAVSEFSIQPDRKPCAFELSEVTLLVPGQIGLGHRE